MEIHCDSSEFDIDTVDLVDVVPVKNSEEFDTLVNDILQMCDHEKKQESVDVTAIGVNDDQRPGPCGITAGPASTKGDSSDEGDDSVFMSDTDSDRTVKAGPSVEIVKNTITLTLINTKTYKEGVLVKEEKMHKVVMEDPREFDLDDILKEAVKEMQDHISK